MDRRTAIGRLLRATSLDEMPENERKLFQQVSVAFLAPGLGGAQAAVQSGIKGPQQQNSLLVHAAAPTFLNPGKEALRRLMVERGLFWNSHKHQKRKRSMKHYAGLDVSLELTSVCDITPPMLWPSTTMRFVAQ